MHKNLGGIFSPNRPVFLARAPGRLDLLGRMALRAGARALHAPLAEALIVAVQLRRDRRIVIRNLNLNKERVLTVEYRLEEALEAARRNDWGAFRTLASATERGWTGYVLAAVAKMVARLPENSPLPGLNVAIQSALPAGAGLGSSAALLTALLLALQEALELPLENAELAETGRQIDAGILQRESGTEDFLTILLGRQEQIVALHGRPAVIEQTFALPRPLQLLAVDPGVLRPEDGERAAELDTALQISLRLLQDVLAEGNLQPAAGVILEQIPAEVWQRRLKKRVPYRCSGAAFLQDHAVDAGSAIDPERRYLPRNVLEFAIAECDRVGSSLHLLEEGVEGEERRRQLGALLLDSHRHYSLCCGPVSPEAEWLVAALSAMGPAAGIYGARAVPQGEATPVAVLTRAGVADPVHNLLARYASVFGKTAHLSAGSSDGAGIIGVVRSSFVS
ncbi:MAG TPA: hypothetical protein PKI62_06380 [bacterium]|nr:hypothetical protein [bacterium]HPR86527.1 hypothetical protein [bacterium]